MVAIVSGNSLGLSSLSTLGQRGQLGTAGQGGSTISTELEDAQIVDRQGFLETNRQILHDSDDYPINRMTVLT
ncbi:hypothetical protein [Paraburkholderia megapolitana]|uniref:Uncharacterized protein n=1 Tax=Paraburkholderia megapolitana TaxID=420953 RepID=A0A1I3VVL1_9BURK|nr:hypothetical protein [Paraburkholderia megapolitana]QDQ82251.1 hypothetical protein FNZ07_13225 [Paraburkholderia megapolitana]SFJ99190.1 hypothetical protein SAMN05192543_1152 [Paraburkholderia megapolitana]